MRGVMLRRKSRQAGGKAKALNMKNTKSKAGENHRFLDEAGDTTFFGKGKKVILGEAGVSKCFIIGMVKFKMPLEEVRQKMLILQDQIENNPLFETPSLLKRKTSKGGFYIHATDDIPEIRLRVFEFIADLKCTFEAVVGRKDVVRYLDKHKGKEEYFYADLLSHLLKNKFQKAGKIVFHISERGRSTKNNNLDLAYKKALQRFQKKGLDKNTENQIVFNVNYPSKDPLLSIADYFCWSIQRVFERGELRYYNFLKDKISTVVDIYDKSNYEDFKNYYGPKNPLTAKNKI